MASLASFQSALKNSSRSLRLRPALLQDSMRYSGALNMRPAWGINPRYYATAGVNQVDPPDYLSEAERKVFDIINAGLQPTELDVQDISGGCGSMYALKVVSDKFIGLPIIKQHRLVNEILGEEIKKWHGVQLKTKAP